ncbi:MAG: GNAT family N-acetyltransferase [Actinomycetota bacterium]|nr:GNAT family N-acetyltransferase [Actinomycetota bacterium]
MFISRATRHDLPDIEELLQRHDWKVPDLKSGTFFFAREGAVLGCLRFIEVAPQTVIVQDMVVDASRRGQGVGEQLMKAAMNSRGGTLYLRCYADLVPYYERFEFAAVERDDLPEPVTAFFDGAGSLEGDTTYLKAR